MFGVESRRACRDRYAQDLFGFRHETVESAKGTEASRGKGLNLFHGQDGQQAVNYDLCMKPRAGARMRTVSRDGRDRQRML